MYRIYHPSYLALPCQFGWEWCGHAANWPLCSEQQAALPDTRIHLIHTLASSGARSRGSLEYLEWKNKESRRRLNQNISREKKPQEHRPKNCNKALGKSPGCKEAQSRKPSPRLSGDRFLHMCESHSHPPNSAQGRWSHSDQLLLRAGHWPDKSLSLVPVLPSSRTSEKSVISLNTVPAGFSSWLSMVHGRDPPSCKSNHHHQNDTPCP